MLKKTKSSNAVQELPIDELRPGKFQPRVLFDEEALGELAASIKADGLLQPITVRPIDDPDDPEVSYEIIAGERRWRAFQLLKVSTIPALVRDLDDKQTAIASLTENLQRASLTPIEEARGYKKLIEELKMKQQDVADRVGKSRPTISNMLRLLTLDKDVIHMLETGQMDAGQARPLVTLPKNQQAEAAETVVTRGLNSRQSELLVKKLIEQNSKEEGDDDDGKDGAESALSFDAELQEELGEAYGENVKVKVVTSSSGVTRITFSANEEFLEELLECLRAGVLNE